MADKKKGRPVVGVPIFIGAVTQKFSAITAYLGVCLHCAKCRAVPKYYPVSGIIGLF